MPKVAVDLDALVAAIEARLRTEDTLPPAELRRAKRHLSVIASRLEAAGLEVGATVRRPLATQLARALEAGPTPLRGLERRVKGATAREVKAAVQALIDGGRAALLVRPEGPCVSLPPPRADVLDGPDLSDTLRRLAAAQKLVRSALASRARPRPAVLRADLEALVGAAAPASRPSAAAPARTDDARATGELAQGIRARVERAGRPLRVPDLLRELGVGRELGARALLAGAARGLYGLEPESGMARLSPAEAEWCPLGPEGTRLAWIIARAPGGAP